MIDADIFSINNNILLCVVDYCSKLTIVKKAGGFSADDLIRAAGIAFTEIGVPKKIVSDAGMNFLSDCFKQFCTHLNIDHAITLSYHQQSNEEGEACVTLAL